MENMEAKNPQDVSKKNAFDELSREELITKCKGLLVIAQKARHSKQELQNEIDQYKIKYAEYENSKKQYDENLHTLQELANSLTEQKLNYITDLESAQNKLKSLNQQCMRYEDEIKNHKADLIVKEKKYADSLVQLSNLDSENISLKRQNNRLVEENEQLLNQLSDLETKMEEFNNIGLQQREQLKVLEEKLQSESTFKATIKQLNDKIADLENMLEMSGSTTESENKMVECENKIKELTQLYENEKINYEKSRFLVDIKLKSYKDKISKCAACINQLKNSRFILSKTVKDYSENIPKWQSDIIAASKILDSQLKKLNIENNDLKDKLAMLEDQLRKGQTNVADQDSTILEFKDQISILRSHNVQLQKENNELTQTNSELNKQVEVLKDNIIDNENIKLQLETLKEAHDVLLSQNTELRNAQANSIELNGNLQNNNANSKTIESLELQIRALESEKSTLVNEKLHARDMALELEGKNETLNSQVHKMQSDVHNLNFKINELIKENAILQDHTKLEKDSQVNTLKSQLAVLQEQNDLLKKDYESLVDMNGLLKEEVETLKLSLEQPKDEADISGLHVSLQADIVKLETKLSAYKQENASLIAEVKESRSKIKEFDSLVTEYEDAKLKLSSYKTENAELLNEMKEINQVLKERGESISKLQKAVGEMERLIDTLEKDRDVLNQEKEDLRKSIDILKHDLNNAKQKTAEECDISQKLLSDKETASKSLAEKESIISSLREEVEKLKQQSGSAAEISNEDMSTSTISKAEEISRMRDLDETFEEKYTKLRIFALKLKKKLNETMMQLQNAEKDKERLSKLLEDTKTSVASSDELDHGRPEEPQRTEQDQTIICELETKVQTLTSTVQSMENSMAELDVLKGKLASVNQRLETEIEAHKATKESLEKVRRHQKKKDVLSLEMEDYEKSMNDLTSKMQENKKKIIQMESTIDTQEGTIASMKVQINLLEEQIKAEEAQNRVLREELQSAIDESKEKDNVIQVKNNIITKLEQEVEDEKRKNEESNLETTALLSDKEKIIISLGEDKAELNNKLKRIEFKCAELHDHLNITKIELEDLKTEHASYKVRAQAVLRQNQTVDHSQEERLKEEAAAFKAHIENLTSKLATVEEQCTEAVEEATAARRRAAEAAGELSRAQQRAGRLHADLARLTQQLEAERTHHKLQVSTLTQCYKTQIAEMETRYHKELDDLKNQLTIARETAPLPAPALDRGAYVVPVIPKEDSDVEMDINVSMIPREEGEGSEAAPSPPPSKYGETRAQGGAHSPVPLERLLEEGVPEDEASDAAALGLTPDQEIQDLRRKLVSQQQRVKHVTVLLAESERECARMAQLSELLKGELRRVRGAAGNNAHNAEYMKNVTLKFLTLPPGDERSRLVPVLQKILSLTNDETSKIQAVAKGLEAACMASILAFKDSDLRTAAVLAAKFSCHIPDSMGSSYVLPLFLLVNTSSVMEGMDPNPKGWGSYLPWPAGK